MGDEFEVVWTKPRLEIVKPDGTLAKYTVDTLIRPLVPIHSRWIPHRADGQVRLIRHTPGRIKEDETVRELGSRRVLVEFDEALQPGKEIVWSIEMEYRNSFTSNKEYFGMPIIEKVGEIIFELVFPAENKPILVEATFLLPEGDEKRDPVQPEFDKQDPRRIIWRKKDPIRGAEYRLGWVWNLVTV